MKKLINYFFAATLLTASLGAAAAKQAEEIKKKPLPGHKHSPAAVVYKKSSLIVVRPNAQSKNANAPTFKVVMPGNSGKKHPGNKPKFRKI